MMRDDQPRDDQPTSTLLNSSIIRLYPQNPVFKIVHDESVKIVKHSKQKHTQHVWR